MVALMAVATAACSGGPRGDASGSGDGSQPASVDQRRAVVEQNAPASPQRAPNAEQAAPAAGSGEVPPQLLAIFKDDLARRALVKPDAIKVVSSTEQQWSDGSLGCPQPGQMYMQVIVAGYRVVLQAGSESYDYHSDQRGNFVVCADGRALAPVKEQMKGEQPAQ